MTEKDCIKCGKPVDMNVKYGATESGKLCHIDCIPKENPPAVPEAPKETATPAKKENPYGPLEEFVADNLQTAYNETMRDPKATMQSMGWKATDVDIKKMDNQLESTFAQYRDDIVSAMRVDAAKLMPDYELTDAHLVGLLVWNLSGDQPDWMRAGDEDKFEGLTDTLGDLLSDMTADYAASALMKAKPKKGAKRKKNPPPEVENLVDDKYELTDDDFIACGENPPTATKIPDAEHWTAKTPYPATNIIRIGNYEIYTVGGNQRPYVQVEDKDKGRSDQPVRYPDGNIAYDHPGFWPSYVKRAVKQYMDERVATTGENPPTKENPRSLTDLDKKVIRAFTEKKALDSKHLSTDGKRLDGNWMGGNNIAEWKGDQIHFNYTGGASAQTVQHAIKREAAPADLEGYKKNPPTEENPKSYEVRGYIRDSSVDDYEKGEDPHSSQTYGDDNEFFSASTQEALVKKLMEFVGTSDMESVLLNSCDEQGRIDIQALTDEDSVVAYPAEIEAWKKGEKKLWSTTYSFHVETVERKRAKLKPMSGTSTNPPTKENPLTLDEIMHNIYQRIRNANLLIESGQFSDAEQVIVVAAGMFETLTVSEKAENRVVFDQIEAVYQKALKFQTLPNPPAESVPEVLQGFEEARQRDMPKKDNPPAEAKPVENPPAAKPEAKPEPKVPEKPKEAK